MPDGHAQRLGFLSLFLMNSGPAVYNKVVMIPQILVNSVIAGSVYALMAMSLTLAFGVTRFFNLAHGAVAAVGGYTVLMLAKTLGVPLELAVVCGVVTAAGLGFGLEKFIYRPLRQRKASSLVLFIASLGAFTVLQALLAIAFTSQFQTLSGLVPKTVVHVAGGAITGVQLVELGVAVAVLIGARLLLSRTRFGKAVRAISDDEEVARVVGINTSRMIGRVFLLCSGVAGLVGVLVGMDTGLEPTMGLLLLLNGVIAAIIGGAGNVYGAFLGGMLLGVVENFGIIGISSEWRDALAFGVLILFLLFRPQGILGAKVSRA